MIILGLLVLESCKERAGGSSQDTASAEMQEAAILAHHQQLGDSLVQLAQAGMLAAVAQAMEKGGPPNAVDFCNIHASSLVNEMAERWNCSLRRTSHLPRNPENAPDADELKILDWYSGLGSEALTSTVWRDGSRVHYASPIQMKLPACLKCHGVPGTDVDAATLGIIKEKYPQDKALNYAMNDFRGMWHLVFEPEPLSHE